MKATLITGASGGIGESLAHQFAAQKHNLILVARNENKLQKVSGELTARYKINSSYIVADLSKAESALQVFNECKSRKCTVNLLINNAGIGSSGEFSSNSLQLELDMMQLNNSSLVALCHLFLQEMKQHKSGGIINIASMAAFFPSPYMAVYAASKAFVKSFTISLNEECKPYGIKVMLFNPGFTSTGFMDTPANKNDWGKTLTSNAYTQTSHQVAVELVNAWEKGRTFHVSGSPNRILAKVSALIPQTAIARIFAKQKRRQMGL